MLTPEPDPVTEFRAGWTPDRLAVVAEGYTDRARRGEFLRLAIVDLELQWAHGHEVTALDYARRFPVLRTPGGPDPELIRAEIGVREKAGELDRELLFGSYPAYHHHLRAWLAGEEAEYRVTRKLDLRPIAGGPENEPRATRVLTPVPTAEEKNTRKIEVLPPPDGTETPGESPAAESRLGAAPASWRPVALVALSAFALGGAILGGIAWAARPVIERVVEVPVPAGPSGTTANPDTAGTPNPKEDTPPAPPGALVMLPPAPLPIVRTAPQSAALGYDALSRLDLLPLLNDWQAFQASSSNRGGGNRDANNFVRTEPNGEQVMLDATGPGVITRVWMTAPPAALTSPGCRIRVYFDGEKDPRIDLTPSEFFGGAGAKYPFTTPLAVSFACAAPDDRSEGPALNCYVPLPFRQRVVVTARNIPYYHINYVRVPGDAVTESWSQAWADRQKKGHEAAARLFSTPGPTTPGPPANLRSITDPGPVEPGANRSVTLTGPGVIESIVIKPEAATTATALTSLVLRVTFDGASGPSVSAPIGEFFGSGAPAPRLTTPVSGVGPAGCYCHWPMPFERVAKVELVNDSDRSLSVEDFEVRWHPVDTLPANAGYFHAAYRNVAECTPGRDFPLLTARGHGKLVGTNATMQSIRNQLGVYFLEGGERVVCDGEAAPRWRGTNTEHYFNGAGRWAAPDKRAMARPLGGLTHLDWDNRLVAGYRWHVPDCIPFARSLQLGLEHGATNETVARYSSVAYYYLDRPAVQPELPPRAARIRDRYFAPPPAYVRGCELDPDVRHTSRGNTVRVIPQPIAATAEGFAPAADRHYRLNLPKGETLEATFRVVAEAEYDIAILLSTGPTFGKVQVQIDGIDVGVEQDGYTTEFFPWRLMPLNRVMKLPPGRHTMTFKSTGNNPRSDGQEFALVGVQLTPNAPPVPRWNTIGTWPCARAADWDGKLPPEQDARPTAKYMNDKIDVGWSAMESADVRFEGTWRAGFGLVYIWSDADRDTGLFLQKDDSLKVILNDQIVYDYWGHSDPAMNTAACPVRLKKGWNKLLVKCANWEGAFGFQVRIPDPGGRLKYSVTEPPAAPK